MRTDHSAAPSQSGKPGFALLAGPLVLGLLALLLICLAAPAALADPLLEPTPAGAEGAPRFEARVLPKPRAGDPREVQDVPGRIIDRTGRGVDGVTVRVSWDGGQFVTQSAGDGFFKFTLTRGRFRIDLIGLAADTAPVDLDGKADVGVEFVERAPSAAPVSPPIQATAILTRTATPTRTPTPTTTALPGATPLRTPVASVGTPIVLLTSTSLTSLQVPPAPTPTPASGLPGLGRLGLGGLGGAGLDLQINLADFLRPFLLGIVVAAGLAVVVLFIVALRR